MEQIVKCRSLTAIFHNHALALGGPCRVEFDTAGALAVHVVIEQARRRTVTITSDEARLAVDLYEILTRVERLLMLFDGAFIPLSELKLAQSDTADEQQLLSFQNKLINTRLSCFTSADFCSYRGDKLLEFAPLLTAELYSQWEALLEELELVHQVYLYFLSDSKITVDIRCAFFIELAEPFVEVVKTREPSFCPPDSQARAPTLKSCLKALIQAYGEDIFGKELESDRDRFLAAMVHSRVRIMHIKREQQGIFFDGKESILYIRKMNLLYRRILFEMLGIQETAYKGALHACVSRLNEWEGIVSQFLLRLSSPS